MFAPGEIVFTKFRIEKMIGKGTFGEVYLVTHIDLNSYQALKVLNREMQDVGSQVYTFYRERFLLEARVGASLHHPNIVRVYDFLEHNGMLALVMDYAAYGSLSERIRIATKENRFLPVQEVTQTGLQIAEGLAELHCNNIIHRDLKPGNILFDSKGRAMIADLGVAQTTDGLTTRSLASDDLPRHPGTPAYMSPEQENNRGYLKPPSDVYAFGLILFEMLTGKNYKNLKPGTRIRNLRTDVPRNLDELVNNMLNINLEMRPWDGEAVVQRLNDITNQSTRKKVITTGVGVAGFIIITILGAQLIKSGIVFI